MDTNDSPLLHWRAHHIMLCGNSYLGRGYTEAYTANLNRMMEQINAAPNGVRVKLVGGPDDWCKPLLAGTDELSRTHRVHCLHPSTQERDALALADLSKIMDRPLTIGSVIDLTAERVLQFRKAFWRATRAKKTGMSDGYPEGRRGCHACSWSKLCDEIALRRYDGVKLFPESKPQHIVPVTAIAAAKHG